MVDWNLLDFKLSMKTIIILTSLLIEFSVLGQGLIGSDPEILTDGSCKAFGFGNTSAGAPGTDCSIIENGGVFYLVNTNTQVFIFTHDPLGFGVDTRLESSRDIFAQGTFLINSNYAGNAYLAEPLWFSSTNGPIGNGSGLTNINGTSLTNLTGITIQSSTQTGTNQWTGDIAFVSGTYNLGSSSGNISDIPTGTNVYIHLTGAGGNFTNCGFAGGRDGREIIVDNQTGYTMGFANQSGSESTAANKILTGTAASTVSTNNPGVAHLIYNGSSSRWEIMSQSN